MPQSSMLHYFCGLHITSKILIFWLVLYKCIDLAVPVKCYHCNKAIPCSVEEVVDCGEDLCYSINRGGKIVRKGCIWVEFDPPPKHGYCGKDLKGETKGRQCICNDKDLCNAGDGRTGFNEGSLMKSTSWMNLIVGLSIFHIFFANF